MNTTSTQCPYGCNFHAWDSGERDQARMAEHIKAHEQGRIEQLATPGVYQGLLGVPYRVWPGGDRPALDESEHPHAREFELLHKRVRDARAARSTAKTELEQAKADGVEGDELEAIRQRTNDLAFESALAISAVYERLWTIAYSRATLCEGMVVVCDRAVGDAEAGERYRVCYVGNSARSGHICIEPLELPAGTLGCDRGVRDGHGSPGYFHPVYFSPAPLDEQERSIREAIERDPNRYESSDARSARTGKVRHAPSYSGIPGMLGLESPRVPAAA